MPSAPPPPPSATAAVLPRPLFASFADRARAGDLADPDPKRRAGAWAAWSIGAVVQMRGVSDREYTALLLEGRFYDPKGTGPRVRPHLEIPSSRLDRPDPEFPDRLAQAGNGLRFPWWVVSEVTALKRCLFGNGPGPIGGLCDELNSRRGALIDAVSSLSAAAGPQWELVEAMLAGPGVDDLRHTTTDPFSAAEVASFFPAATDFGLEVRFDPRLAEKNGRAAARRVGIWQLSGVDGDPFSMAVTTPRLTANSLFRDPLFAAEREAPAALLVRGLLLRRLLRRHLHDTGPSAAVTRQVPRPGVVALRAVPARDGAKSPEASLQGAVRWLQAYPDPEAAWAEVASWAQKTGGLLTVTQDGYVASHRAALRKLRRADDPDRQDINVVLPLAWLDGTVVRLTCVQRSS